MSKPKILVVEDYPTTKIIFQSLLGKCGVHAMVVDTHAGAVDALTQNQDIDVVLLDGALLGSDRGEQVAAHIVAQVWPNQEKKGQQPTVFVTMSSDPYDAPGASHIYDKEELLRLFRDVAKAQTGIGPWIEEMRSKRPAVSPQYKPNPKCDNI